MKLFLASKSTTRRQMLKAAGVPFECIEISLNEEDVKTDLRATGANAPSMALELAKAKALSEGHSAENLVLGSDQALELHNGLMLDKPKSIDEARAQLMAMSGNWHLLHSAAALARDGKIVWTGIESVKLHVRALSDAFIDHYLAREFETTRWSVGGYRFEGFGVQLFERVEGSHFAILGLPLFSLLNELRSRGLLMR